MSIDHYTNQLYFVEVLGAVQSILEAGSYCILLTTLSKRHCSYSSTKEGIEAWQG